VSQVVGRWSGVLFTGGSLSGFFVLGVGLRRGVRLCLAAVVDDVEDD